jgi:hypothetical protein
LMVNQFVGRRLPNGTRRTFWKAVQKNSYVDSAKILCILPSFPLRHPPSWLMWPDGETNNRMSRY